MKGAAVKPPNLISLTLGLMCATGTVFAATDQPHPLSPSAPRNVTVTAPGRGWGHHTKYLSAMRFQQISPNSDTC